MSWLTQLLERMSGRTPTPADPPPLPGPGPVPPPPAPPSTGKLVGIVARGDSMAYGSGLGNPLTVDPADTWLRELGKHLGVQVFNAGVPGTYTRDAIAAQAKDTSHEAKGWLLVILDGHNDIGKGISPDVVVAAYRTMAAKARGGYLALGLVTGLTGEKGSDYYQAVIAPGGVNDKLRAEHGIRYFDTHRFLVGEAMGLLGMTPTTQDKLDITSDITPDSLRADKGRGHLNERGQQALADKLATLL